MTTSFNSTRDQLIERALRLVGSKRRGVTLESEEVSETGEALNAMIKGLMADGLHLWKLKELTVFLQKGLSSYPIPGNVTESYAQSTLSAAASTNDTVVNVYNSTGMTTGGYVGIELDDGLLHWSTATVSGLVLTLDTALPSAAAKDNIIYGYTTRADRPLRVIEARHEGFDGNEIPVETVARSLYFALPTKSTEGRVNQVYYDPQLTTGKLYVWPTANSVRDRLNITVYMPFEDFNNGYPDFPQEWLEPLAYLLASRIGPEKGLPLDRQMYLDTKADMMLSKVLQWDDGEEDIMLIPE